MKYSQLRLEIVEYFDSVISELDLVVESQMAKEAAFEVVLNERREKQIAGINQLSKACLDRVESEMNQALTLRDTLDEFYFVVEFAGLPFVIKTNMYVERRQIDHFKTLVKWNTLTHQERLDELIGHQTIFTNLDTSVDAEPLFKIEEEVIEKAIHTRFRDADNLFLDFSSWFAQGQELDSVTFHKIEDRIIESPITVTSTIKSPFNIKQVYIEWPAEPEEFEPLRRALGHFCRIFESAQKIVIYLEYPTDDYDSERCQHMKGVDSRIELRLGGQFHEQSLVADYVYSLECWTNNLTHQTCLHGFRNLRDLYLAQVGHDFDWSLLDTLRPSLTSLHLVEVISLDWIMFAGMTNLEELKIYSSRLSHVELDEKSQIFADLVKLERLYLSVDECLVTSGCQIELPMLNQLTMRFQEGIRPVKQFDARQINIGFKLPALSTLGILDSEFYPELSSSVLRSVVDSFSSTETLILDHPDAEVITVAAQSLKNMSKLKLKNLRQLELLAAIENLRHLEIDRDEPGISVELLTELHRLTSLEVLYLPGDCADKQTEIISCLPSIKQVHFDGDYRNPREKFVLSDSLNKLVYTML